MIQAANNPGGEEPVERVTKRLAIEGLVQGVGFRDFMQRRARMLGVTGWVRNRTDGSVEAVVQGSADAVDQVVALARQGPRSAHVTGVRVFDADGQFTVFEMRPTE
jgi:acylphosphatase